MATVEAGNFKIYVNGQWANSSPLTGGGNTTGQAPAFLNVGPDGGGSARFRGTLDEVRVYSRSLTAADVAELKTEFDATNDLSHRPGRLVELC